MTQASLRLLIQPLPKPASTANHASNDAESSVDASAAHRHDQQHHPGFPSRQQGARAARASADNSNTGPSSSDTVIVGGIMLVCSSLPLPQAGASGAALSHKCNVTLHLRCLSRPEPSSPFSHIRRTGALSHNEVERIDMFTDPVFKQRKAWGVNF